MKQQDLINNWKVIKALKKGKAIQYFDTHTRLWLDTNNIDNIEVVEHRVRPEKKPNFFDDEITEQKDCIITFDEAKLAKQANISVQYKYEFEFADSTWTDLNKVDLHIIKGVAVKPLLRIHPDCASIWPKHYEYIKAWVEDSKSIQTKFSDETTWHFVNSIPEYLPELEIRYTPTDLKVEDITKSILRDEYVPFTFAVLKHKIGYHVFSKDSYKACLIIEVTPTHITAGGRKYTYAELLQYFTFSDGSPCGLRCD